MYVQTNIGVGLSSYITFSRLFGPKNALVHHEVGVCILYEVLFFFFWANDVA